MKKDIKDYLHLYLGQEIVFSDDDYKSKGYKLSPHFLGDHSGSGWTYKVVLRPLSDMTEDEEMNVSNIIGSITATSFIEAWTHKSKYLINIHEYPELFLYLIKQGFDLFGLIEAELAIDKTNRK